MSRRPVFRLLLAGLLAAGAVALPGCGGGKPPPMSGGTGNETVRGKVSYNGEPVPYGFVLFFNHTSFNPQTGVRRPIAMCPIGADSTYQATNVPAGPVEIVVACDPEADPHSLTVPRSTIPSPGGPPGVGPGSFQPGGPPGGPMPGGPPSGIATPGSGAVKPPGPPPEVKLPPGAPRPPTAAPAGNLSAAQQKMLKEVHDKYGPLGRARLTYIVKEGEQTYNVELK